MTQQSDKFNEARELFREHGGHLRTKDALRLGIHPRTLYQMRDAGELERLGRGLYRLSDLPPLGDHDLVTVALKSPNAVICLISALSFHGITTQIPHEIYLALPRGAEPPRITHPPIHVYWFKGEPFTEGVETHRIDQAEVKVYCAEKTIADCFKYRNKLGMDVALEALRSYWSQNRPNVDKLLRFARVCRVEKIIRPYIESLL